MQPNLVGVRLEALVFEGFVHNGERVGSVNAIFLKTTGIWYRLVLDCGTVHWREETTEPKPWSVAEEGWEYPHCDAGAEYDLTDTEVVSVKSIASSGGVVVEMRFADGRCATFRNHEDHTSFNLAVAGPDETRAGTSRGRSAA